MMYSVFIGGYVGNVRITMVYKKNRPIVQNSRHPRKGVGNGALPACGYGSAVAAGSALGGIHQGQNLGKKCVLFAKEVNLTLFAPEARVSR